MKVLIAEDDPNKLAVLRQFLVDAWPGIIITVAASFHAAKREILNPEFDLIVLDMQLPQFDKSQFEEGGRRQSLAGLELLRQMKRRAIKTPAVVVTQFREFGEETDPLSFDDLTQQLSRLELSNYYGIVYYNAKIANWRLELESKIAAAIKKGVR